MFQKKFNFSSLFSCSPFVGFLSQNLELFNFDIKKKSWEMDHDWNRKSNRPFQNHITFPMKAAHPLRDISFLTFTSLPSFYHFQKKISNVVQLNWYQINFGGLSYVSFLLHNIGNFFRYSISIKRNVNFSFLSLRWIVVLYFLQKDIFSG